MTEELKDARWWKSRGYDKQAKDEFKHLRFLANGPCKVANKGKR